MKTTKNQHKANKIINLLATGCFKQALDDIVYSNFYLDPEFNLVRIYFGDLNLSEIEQNYPNSMDEIIKISSLVSLYNLQTELDKNELRLLSDVNALNISKVDCIKVLFYGIHLPTLPFFANVDLERGKDALAAVKTIISKINDGSNKTITPEALAPLLNLLMVTSDKIKNLRNFDLIINHNYHLVKLSENEFEIRSSNVTKNNALRFEYYKKQYERNWRFVEAEEAIKNEAYIKHIDEVYGSNEGFPGIYHSANARVTSSTPGFQSIPFDENISKKMGSTNPKECDEAITQIFGDFFKRYFHYYLRYLIKRIYNPAIKTDIKQKISLSENVSFTTYEFFQIVGCILTLLHIKHTSPLLILNDLNTFDSYRMEHEPEMQDKEFRQKCYSELMHYLLKDLENRIQEVAIVESVENIIKLIQNNIPELKARSKEDLEKALDFLSRENSELPFNLLYKTNNTNYCYLLDTNLDEYLFEFYNYVVSPELFDKQNKKNKAESNSINKNSETREKEVCSYLFELFDGLTKYKKKGIKLSRENTPENLREKDFFAYSESENVLFYAEVKLSNVFPRKSVRKKKWVEEYILKKGKEQIAHSLEILKTKSGMDKLGYQLNVENLNNKKPQIHAFIVCDCYFADHMKVELMGNLGSFTVVNIFEIESIIKGSSIGEDIKSVSEPLVSGELNKLISALQNDTFWQAIYKMKDQPVETYESRSFAQNLILKTFV